MRHIAILAFSALLSLCLTSQGQSSDQALKDLRVEILKKPFIVRGFSDDPVTIIHWNGTTLSLDEPKLHTLGVIKPDSVELKGDKLKISGHRQTLVRDTDGTLKLGGDSRPTIIVDLQGADPAQVLPMLKTALFFATPQDAFAALPPGYAKIASGMVKQRDPKASSHPTDWSCPSEGQEFKRVKVLQSADAEFPEEARRARTNANVEAAFTVGVDGLAHNIWIVRPAGLGFDEKSAEAISKYKFSPATCDGKPVETTLFMDVNFAIM